MNFRHEWKHEINAEDILLLRQRLQAVMKMDEHAVQGRYEVRSLYFDSNNGKNQWNEVSGKVPYTLLQLQY